MDKLIFYTFCHLSDGLVSFAIYKYRTVLTPLLRPLSLFLITYQWEQNLYDQAVSGTTVELGNIARIIFF